MMDADHWTDQMRKRPELNCKKRTELRILGLLLALQIAALSVVWGGTEAQVQDTVRATDAAGASAVPSASDTASAPARPAPQLARPHPKSTLEDRVRLLSEALILDAAQQSQLRMALVSQREQVMRVWDDPSVPPAYRIGATRNISEQTADRIRSFLTEDQRKKFNPPRQAHERDPKSIAPSVEDWMKPPPTTK